MCPCRTSPGVASSSTSTRRPGPPAARSRPAPCATSTPLRSPGVQISASLHAETAEHLHVGLGAFYSAPAGIGPILQLSGGVRYRLQLDPETALDVISYPVGLQFLLAAGRRAVLPYLSPHLGLEVERALGDRFAVTPGLHASLLAGPFRDPVLPLFGDFSLLLRGSLRLAATFP